MHSGSEPGGLGNQPLTVGGGVCGAALPSHFGQLQCDPVTLKFDGHISVEHENDWKDSVPQVKHNIDFVKARAK